MIKKIPKYKKTVICIYLGLAVLFFAKVTFEGIQGHGISRSQYTGTKLK